MNQIYNSIMAKLTPNDFNMNQKMLEQQIIAQLYVLQSSYMNEKELNKQLLYIY